MAARLEEIKDSIIALQPVYTATGNATRIFLYEGDKPDARGIRSVLAALARIYAIDLPAQRKNLAMRLNRFGVLPFHLEDDRVFIPLKMRKAAAAKDMVYGYVDVRFIGDITPAGQHGCRVSLPGERQLEILSRPSTVLQCQHMGLRLLDMLQKEKSSDPEERVFADAGIYLHKTIKGLERRLEHIEDVITDHENKGKEPERH